MLVKLHYTANTQAEIPFGLFAEIVNTPTITTLTGLMNHLSTATAHASYTANLSLPDSFIIRTDSPDNVVAHFRGSSSPELTFKMPVHDNPGEFTYNMFTGSTGTWYHYVSSTITGDIAGTQSIADTPVNATAASNLSMTAEASTGNSYTASTGNTFWLYINDYAVMMYMCEDSSTKTGQSNNGSLNNMFIGAQYDRYDYWNLPSNGFQPTILLNEPLTGAYGGISRTSWNVTKIVDATPANKTVWPVETNIGVYNGLGNFFTQDRNLDTNNSSYGYVAAMISSSPFYRQHTADLQHKGVTIFPMTWARRSYNAMGGNISSVSKIYFFNGDYYPGDTVTFGSQEYMLFTPNSGYQTREAIAVPMA